MTKQTNAEIAKGRDGLGSEKLKVVIGELLTLPQTPENVRQLVLNFLNDGQAGLVDLYQGLDQLGGELKDTEAGQRLLEIMVQIKEILEITRPERKVDRPSEVTIVEKMAAGEELEKKEKETAASMLERRDWGRIYNGLENGDIVLFFSIPKDSVYNLKRMNTLMGETRSDKALIEGRNAREKTIRDFLKKKRSSLSEEQISSLLLSLEKQSDVIKINAELARGLGGEEGVRAMLEEVCEAVNARMTEYFGEVEFAGEKSEYRLNYGLATAIVSEGKSRHIDIVRSVGRASVQAKLMEFERLVEEKGMREFGTIGQAETYEAKVAEVLRAINIIGNELMCKMITDQSGRVYEIFSEKNGKRAIDKDLLRQIRKGEFKMAKGEDQGVYDKIYVYYRLLGILDFVKPHTKEEIEGKKPVSGRNKKMSLSEILKRNERLAEAARQDIGISVSALKEAAEVLFASEKTDLFTSDVEFRAEAMKINECVIVSVDLLDVGLDQYLQYESLAQEIDEENIDDFEEKMLMACDRLTQRIREFRQEVAFLVDKYSNSHKKSVRVGKVGGDEIMLALPKEMASEEFIFMLKGLVQEIGARLATAKSERSNGSDVGNEHDNAVKRTEEGIKLAKDVEKKARELEYLLDKDNRLKDKTKKWLAEVPHTGKWDTIAGLVSVAIDSSPPLILDFFVDEEKFIGRSAGLYVKGPMEDAKKELAGIVAYVKHIQIERDSPIKKSRKA